VEVFLNYQLITIMIAALAKGDAPNAFVTFCAENATLH
jgi:hypothetical protein